MAKCQNCPEFVFEHYTSDSLVLYCPGCGWEHREPLSIQYVQQFRAAKKVVRKK